MFDAQPQLDCAPSLLIVAQSRTRLDSKTCAAATLPKLEQASTGPRVVTNYRPQQAVCQEPVDPLIDVEIGDDGTGGGCSLRPRRCFGD